MACRRGRAYISMRAGTQAAPCRTAAQAASADTGSMSRQLPLSAELAFADEGQQRGALLPTIHSPSTQPDLPRRTLVLYCVRPTIAPRASSRHQGASRPPKAGTKYTPPLSGTDPATASLSAAAPRARHRGRRGRANMTARQAPGSLQRLDAAPRFRLHQAAAVEVLELGIVPASTPASPPPPPLPACRPSHPTPPHPPSR